MTNLESLIFSWMEHLAILKGRRPITVTRYETVVRSFLKWANESPTEITPDIIGEWLKHLFYEQKNLSNASRASKLSALKSFFGWLKYTGHRTDDPTEAVPSPKVHDSLPQKFSTEELRLLFAAPPRDKTSGIRDLALLKTMYAAGPRVSELVRLDINHIIDTGGYIRIQIINGKGGKSRTVTLCSTPSRALREWLLIRREIQTDDPALFIRLHGSPGRMGIRNTQNILKKYARVVGIKDADAFVHKMRVTFASDIYDAGNDTCPHCRRKITYNGPVEVSMLLGHENLDTVMRYIAISERVLRKTAIPDRRFNEIEEGGDRDAIGKPGGN